MSRNSQQCSLLLSQSRYRGAALVEFAIILPILIILAFGFTELGRALYQKNQLTKEVNIGARFMARFPDAVDVEDNCARMNEDGQWNTAEDGAKALVAGSVTGLEEDDIIVDSRPEPIEVNDDEGTTTLVICVIEVSASMDFNALAGDTIIPMLNLGRITLTARTEERYLDL